MRDTVNEALEKLSKTISEERHDPTIDSFLQAFVHEAVTTAADKLAQSGFMDTDNRIKLSSAVGDMLEVFRTSMLEKCPEITKTKIPSETALRIMEM